MSHSQSGVSPVLVSGTMQSAGVAVRLTSANDYYVVRVSALEEERKAHGISEHTWREARVRVGGEVVRVGFGKGSYVVWKLGPDITDEIVAG